MKRILVIVLLSLLFLIIDNSVMPFISIRGYYPNLLFIFAISLSIINGPEEGIFFGILTGAMQDLYFTNAFGINIFTNMLMCVAAGIFGKSIRKEKLLMPVLSTFLLSFVKGVIVFCLLYLLKQKTHIEDVIFNSMYSMIISIIMYKKIYKLCEKRFMVKQWKF
ncbi:MAG: rod shape-determining protein MreD [Bacillota bacterium]|nr:rod shape-determining protein MreD [Bacillota bacterium]